MKVNHFIVGAIDVSSSIKFYKRLFKFKESSENPGREGGMTMEGRDCDILILPFPEEMLPNPAHFAFEAESLSEFESILKSSVEMNLKPRSMPSRDAKKGSGEFTRAEVTYRNFYISDPSGCNVEVVVKL